MLLPSRARSSRLSRWASFDIDGVAPEPVTTGGAARSGARSSVPCRASGARACFRTFRHQGPRTRLPASCLEKLGLRVVTVDISTSGRPSAAMVHPREVARCHPQGERAVFTGERGSAVTEMALAFEHFIVRRRDLGGLISAGGSGNTALATPAMRRLPIGMPKVMVSTVASGDVKPYVGPSDICMMYSVTDVSGINRISERVLAKRARARRMIAYAKPETDPVSLKRAIGLTMLADTPCVQALTPLWRRLRLHRVPRHRTRPVDGKAGESSSIAVIDVTTTESRTRSSGGC